MPYRYALILPERYKLPFLLLKYRTSPITALLGVAFAAVALSVRGKHVTERSSVLILLFLTDEDLPEILTSLLPPWIALNLRP